MKSKTVKEMYIDAYKVFFDKLYGEDLDYTKEDEFIRYKEKVEEMARQYKDDFDVMISVKYRCCSFKVKGADYHLKPKSILHLASVGINIPEDATAFQLDAKFAVTQNGKIKYFTKKEDLLFSEKILFSNFTNNKNFVDMRAGKKISKIKNFKVFSKKEMAEFSKLIKFKKVKTEEDLLGL